MNKLLCFALVVLLTFSTAVPVKGAELQPMLQLTKYTDGVIVRIDKTGTIQSIQLSVEIESAAMDAFTMNWDKSLESAYKHYETKRTEKGFLVTFYVDSKNQINNSQNIVTLGRMYYQGYQNRVPISSDGKIKTLNLGLQEMEQTASIVVDQKDFSSTGTDSGGDNGSSGDNGSGGNNGSGGGNGTGGNNGSGGGGSGSTSEDTDTGKDTEADNDKVTDKDTETDKDDEKEEPAKEPEIPLEILVKKNQKTLTLNQLKITADVKNNKVTVKIPEIKLADNKTACSLSIELDRKQLTDELKKLKAEKVTVDLVVPESITSNTKLTIQDIIVPQDVMNLVRTQKKQVVFSLKNSKNKLIYSVAFDGKELKRSTSYINLAIKTFKAGNATEYKKATAAKTVAVAAFTQADTFPGKASVTISVSAYGFKENNQLHLNQYKKGKPLVYLSRLNKVKKDGTVTFKVSQGGTYLLTTEGFVKSGTKTYYFTNTGKKLTGTHKINGKTYQFDKNGVLIK